MRTRQDFIARWRTLTAGTITLGTSRARVQLIGRISSGPGSAEEVLAKIDETTDELLGRLYDDLTKDMPLPQSNGKTTAKGPSQ
jgi:hypothetical protein